MVDAIVKGVLQTRRLYRAISANPARDLDPDAVVRKER